MRFAEPQPRIAPPALLPGGCVGVVAPAGAVKRDEVESGVALLEGAGYRVRLGASVWKRFGYFAGTDEERLRDLMDMFGNPEIDAIFAARGGYGCARLLPFIDPDFIRSHAKVFVGSSDCTALLQFFVDRCGVVAFHGPVVAAFSSRPESMNGLLRMLTGKTEAAIALPPPLRGGKAEGALRGGCLSILASLLGTPFAPTVEPTVWFFEDVNEKPYRIDRMLTQWSQAGLWQSTEAVLWGEMVGCTAPSGSWDVWQVIERHMQELSVPVVTGIASGHGSSRLTLPMGVRVRVANDRLEFLQPWVTRLDTD
ncbi:MAG: LD-carboxypeptidase [Candidatus Binatia bacterium]|nr:LD-carboxypeptidase [Candidatus Binatia bacterium]